MAVHALRHDIDVRRSAASRRKSKQLLLITCAAFAMVCYTSWKVGSLV
jgi:hypothetical protein